MIVLRRGDPNNYARFKPKGYENHLTLAEVCNRVQRDRSRVLQLERKGVLPSPIRVKVGRLKVRLYSEEEAAKIEEHFRNARPGNPKQRKNG